MVHDRALVVTELGGRESRTLDDDLTAQTRLISHKAARIATRPYGISVI